MTVNTHKQRWGSEFEWLTPDGVHDWLRRFYEGDGIGIIRADTSTAWFHDYILRSPYLVFPKGRVRYINNHRREKAKGGPGFASVLFCAGSGAPILRERGRRLGVVMCPAVV